MRAGGGHYNIRRISVVDCDLDAPIDRWRPGRGQWVIGRPLEVYLNSVLVKSRDSGGDGGVAVAIPVICALPLQ